MRRQVLLRDDWRCQRCGKVGRLEVDHIKPLHWGGDPWCMQNLQALCRGCHIRKTQHELRGQPVEGRAAWEEVRRARA